MKRGGARLGQNFLVDEGACLRIANALGDARERTVVEIGPGHGAITAHLATRCRRLHCIEFDPALARELQFRFRNEPQVTVHQEDILQTDLRRFLPETAGEGPDHRLDVVGNLPYYITSDILLHLFAAAREGLLERAVLMVQREVAQRVAAKPGSRDYGSLSALAYLHAEVEELFTLPPSAFSPPPEVFSTVIRLQFRTLFERFGVDFEGFNALLRACFAQKRKTLANNLRSAGYSAAAVEAAWPPGLPTQVRAEAVPVEGMAAIYRSLASLSPLSSPAG